MYGIKELDFQENANNMPRDKHIKAIVSAKRKTISNENDEYGIAVENHFTIDNMKFIQSIEYSGCSYKYMILFNEENKTYIKKIF